MPWPRLAGKVLAASGLAMGALYSTSLRSTVTHVMDAQLLPPVQPPPLYTCVHAGWKAWAIYDWNLPVFSRTL